jgi:hypothetical protein
MPQGTQCRLVVRFMAQLKLAAGKTSDEIQLSSPQPVGQVLAALAQRHSDSFRQLLLTPGGGLQPTLLLFLGDEQVRPEELVPRGDGDVLTVLSPMAGG